MLSPNTTVRAHRLRKLRLHEVSLVDRPANEHATIVLAKRDAAAPADFAAMQADINASLKKLQSSVAALSKSMSAAAPTTASAAPVHPFTKNAGAALHALAGGDAAMTSALLQHVTKSAPFSLDTAVAKMADPECTKLASLIVEAATTDNAMCRNIAVQHLERVQPALARILRTGA